MIGTFVLMAATGSLMFFHLNTGLNKTAHEWLGWAMLACAAVLVLSFVPLGDSGGKPPFVAPMQALASAPLSTVAQVGGISTAELRARLGSAGVVSQSDAQTIKELVGPDLGQQMRTLGKVLGG